MAPVVGVVERLDPVRIADEKQTLLAPVPDRESEHAAEAPETATPSRAKRARMTSVSEWLRNVVVLREIRAELR